MLVAGVVKLPNVLPTLVRLMVAGVVMLAAGESTTVKVCVWAHAPGTVVRSKARRASFFSSRGTFFGRQPNPTASRIAFCRVQPFRIVLAVIIVRFSGAGTPSGRYLRIPKEFFVVVPNELYEREFLIGRANSR
jgi:hypothetical protein